MEPIESEGSTVAEAVEAALRQHGLRREQVEVAVLQEASSGFMGLGAKPARVRLTEKRWGPASPAAPAPARPAARPPARAATASRSERPPRRDARPPRAPASRPPEARPAEARLPETRSPATHAPKARTPEPRPALTPAQAAEACDKAQQIVTELLRMMTIAAPTVSASWDADLERVKAQVESQDATLLVGRDGRVLEALQFLATLMLSRGATAPTAVQVDALSYWEKREHAILEEARRGIEKVNATGKPYRLEPMDASMRRLIHRTFASNPDIMTASEGEGPWRKIVVRPRKG